MDDDPENTSTISNFLKLVSSLQPSPKVTPLNLLLVRQKRTQRALGTGGIGLMTQWLFMASDLDSENPLVASCHFAQVDHVIILILNHTAKTSPGSNFQQLCECHRNVT